MDAKYLAEIKARLDAGRLPMKSDMEALLAEVERLTEDNIALKAELQDSHQDHIDDFMRLGTETATLKKALTRACEEITKHTCECPASLYDAEMCENCNDDDCDSNRTDRWCDYFIQAQEQEREKWKRLSAIIRLKAGLTCRG